MPFSEEEREQILEETDLHEIVTIFKFILFFFYLFIYIYRENWKSNCMMVGWLMK